MSELTRAEIPLKVRLGIWARGNAYLLAAFFVAVLVRIQFFGVDTVLYTINLQTRPELKADQREMLAEEAYAQRLASKPGR